jgi:hypothetical protein
VIRYFSPLSGAALAVILLQLALAHAGEVRDHRRTATAEAIVRDHHSR